MLIVTEDMGGSVSRLMSKHVGAPLWNEVGHRRSGRASVVPHDFHDALVTQNPEQVAVTDQYGRFPGTHHRRDAAFASDGRCQRQRASRVGDELEHFRPSR